MKTNSTFVIKFLFLKTHSLLSLIDELKSYDFPYQASIEALNEISKPLKSLLDSLENVDESVDIKVVMSLCLSATMMIHNNLLLLGFIQRSTDTRNPFEIYAPLKQLTKDLIGQEIKLILSSEWDFSPHIYQNLLKDFLLIGLPASEGGNPLLLPLVGHELGHKVWKQINIENILLDELLKISERFLDEKNTVLVEFLKTNQASLSSIDFHSQKLLQTSFGYAIKQLEESFCDFIGLYLFKNSFLNAFAYLLSPGVKFRSPNYPEMHTRIVNLEIASKIYNIPLENKWSDCFSKPNISSKSSVGKDINLHLSDHLSQELILNIIEKAENFVKSKNITLSNFENTQEIFIYMTKWEVPHPTPNTIFDIVDAAWQAFLNPEYTQNTNYLRNQLIYEVTLKNLEVLEYNRRIN